MVAAAMFAVGVVGTMMADDPMMPAPDPSIGIAQKQMADLAGRQQDFYEKNIAPEMIASMRQNAVSQAKAADIAEKVGNQRFDQSERLDKRYWGTQVPLEDQLISEAKSYNTGANFDRMSGQAGADVEQQADIARGTTARGLQMRGIDLGSNAAISSMSDMNTQVALAKAGAMNKTRQVAEQMGWTRLGEATALGKGLPSFGATSAGIATSAAGTLSNAGSAGVDGVTRVNNSVNGTTSAIGGLWGNYGNLGVASSQIASANAKFEAENDPWAKMAGMAVGAGSQGLITQYGGKP